MSISLKNIEDRVKALESVKYHQIKEVKHGNDGYIWFNSGLLIQWFRSERNAYGDTDNWAIKKFPVPFSEKPWFVSNQLVLVNPNSSFAYNERSCIRFGKCSATEFWYFNEGGDWPTYMSLILAIGLKVYYTFSIILMLILSNFLNIFIRKEVI